MDFTWFYFIGINKLGFTKKETGRLTLRLFSKYYQHYKDIFDLELRMMHNNKTYAQLQDESIRSEQWL